MSMQCTHVLAVSNVGVHRRLLSTFLCAVGPCFSPADVFPVMHHSRCVSRYASQPMCFLLCTTADVFPVMHHSQCLSCYASRFCFGQLESCRENPKKSRNLWQTHHTHTQLRDWYLVLRHLPGSGKGRMRLSLPS